MPLVDQHPPTRARERYLLMLYKLQRHADGAAVSMGDLATALAVAAGSATTMMKRLGEAGYVAYTPYSGVRLSKEGRRVALQLVRRHRLLESFLVSVLDYDWSDVHAVAEALEHGVDDDLLARIDAYLGHPVADPHGNPIPSPAGELIGDEAVPVADCQPGDLVRFVRIGELSPAMLDLLASHGWQPQVTGTVTDNNAITETLSLLTGDHPPITMSRGAAEQLFVEVL